jgi:dihydrofolate reductase
MRKLVVNTFLTVDGVMQAPGGREEDPSGGFTLGGWAADYWDDDLGDVMGEFMGKPFDLVLGRKTYEIFAAHWPYVDDPGATALNEATKYVASRTLPNLEWQNSVLLEGDVTEAIAELKRQDGPELQVHGSSNLVQTLLRHNLVDQFGIWTFPLVVGPGKRLFSDGTIPNGLKLTDSKVFSTGVVMTIYEPAGEVVPGSFALEEPSEAELERRRKLED